MSWRPPNLSPLGVSAQLREIAAQLQAMIDGGDFALCFEHVRTDMALLPDKLAELASELERA